MATQKSMKHGEEPTELLLAVAWSQIETLLERGQARLFVGNGEVAVIFANTLKTDDGLVLAKSVGKQESVGK